LISYVYKYSTFSNAAYEKEAAAQQNANNTCVALLFSKNSDAAIQK